MNIRDVTGSMKPLDIQADSSSTPYQLSEGGDDEGTPVVGGGSSASFMTRITGYLWSPNGRELIFCTIFGIATYFLTYLWMTPNQRSIPYQYLEATGTYILNLANNEELVEESTVPELQLGVVIVACPVIQLIFACLHGFIGDVHKTLCVYLVAIPLNELTTWTMKVYVGYLRPNFYNLCQPDNNYDECTDDLEWQNGRLSFPSGHASWAFCALTLLHLYLEQCVGYGRLLTQQLVGLSSSSTTTTTTTNNNDPTKQQQLLWREPSNALSYRIGSILCLIPIALAIFIACSRVVDNMHFPADVVAGSLLGASIASYFHFLWFPNLK